MEIACLIKNDSIQHNSFLFNVLVSEWLQTSCKGEKIGKKWK